eukprot:scaffold41736_cov21-Tisochrysis_lutea.AAC.1
MKDFQHRRLSSVEEVFNFNLLQTATPNRVRKQRAQAANVIKRQTITYADLAPRCGPIKESKVGMAQTQRALGRKAKPVQDEAGNVAVEGTDVNKFEENVQAKAITCVESQVTRSVWACLHGVAVLCIMLDPGHASQRHAVLISQFSISVCP